jgi:hypothetical protein
MTDPLTTLLEEGPRLVRELRRDASGEDGRISATDAYRLADVLDAAILALEQQQNYVASRDASPLQVLMEWRGKAIRGGAVGSVYYECARQMEEAMLREHDAARGETPALREALSALTQRASDILNETNDRWRTGRADGILEAVEVIQRALAASQGVPTERTE